MVDETVIATIPNLVTSVRLVFFAGFIYLIEQGEAATMAGIFLFGLAWGLDMIDGWLARRLRQTTNWGYVYDKAVDRVVLAGGLLALTATATVPIYTLGLLTKDIITSLAAAHRRGRGGSFVGVGRGGKIISLLQGIVIVWVMMDWRGGGIGVLLAAAAGLMVGIGYWRRIDK